MAIFKQENRQGLESQPDTWEQMRATSLDAPRAWLSPHTVLFWPYKVLKTKAKE
jgi:hypothetical protein